MKFILRQYARAFFILREIRMISVIVIGLLIISGVVGYIIAKSFPVIFGEYMDMVMMTLSKSGLLDNEGNISTLMLFFNNARVALQGIGEGLLPFFFIPTLLIIINGFVIGVVLAVRGGSGLIVPILFFSGIMPHGIFEFAALIISWSTGILLCYSTIKLIFRRIEPERVVELLKSAAAVYCCLVVPLLIVAAIVEANLTPIILEAALSKFA